MPDVSSATAAEEDMIEAAKEAISRSTLSERKLRGSCCTYVSIKPPMEPAINP
jgi:hypothetical protein